MWGTQKPQGTYPSKRRFISTCCGKNDYFRAVATVLRTPSPRVWRAQGKTQRELAEHRLIPTCVGSTTFCITAGLEHSGSSPRVWGAPDNNSVPIFTVRLIPTCVGSTVWHAHHQQPEQAHPHVCGEHAAASIMPSKVIGSSPRVWGARVAVELNAQAGRLIPTCVGSTGFSRPRIVSHPAHPHVCGEHFPCTQIVGSPSGSSPRVWGAQEPPTG